MTINRVYIYYIPYHTGDELTHPLGTAFRAEFLEQWGYSAKRREMHLWKYLAEIISKATRILVCYYITGGP